MALSKSRTKTSDPKEQIYCQIRRDWVTALPEEKVRQQVISHMVGLLGYPLACITVEQSLQQMPHLASKKHLLPMRRADIICFAKGIHPQYDLYPLLLLECKAVPLTATTIRQVTGYNYYLQAHFIAIANHQEIRIGWLPPGQTQYTFKDGLPHYQQLLQHNTRIIT